MTVAGPNDGRGRRDDDRVPVAISAGPARDCVSIAMLHDSVVRSERVIDFITGRRSAYRVVLPQPCPSLGWERRFAYETSLSQMCSADIITVLYESPLSR